MIAQTNEAQASVALGREFTIVKGRDEMPHRLFTRGPLPDGMTRVSEAGREWLPAVVAALTTWQVTEAFAAFLVLYLPLAVWDYVLAQRGREADPNVARNGISSKGVAVTIACVLHGVGFLAQRYGIVGIPAPLGVFFVVGLIVSEARSVNKHHRRLTGESIPYLGPALAAVEAAQDRIIAGDGTASDSRPRRRRGLPGHGGEDSHQ